MADSVLIREFEKTELLFLKNCFSGQKFFSVRQHYVKDKKVHVCYNLIVYELYFI